MATGIMLTALSAVAAVGGATFLGIGASIHAGDNGGAVLPAYFGLAGLAGGAVLAGAGVPLWIYGAKEVPDTEASFVPSVAFGNRSVALAWRF
jgi:hypothetical protein